MEMLNRRGFIKRVGLATATLAVPQFVAAERTSQRPNVVFILIDDMGWRDAGFMGSEYYDTPNIDTLAREGMVFTNAYANAANCAPTRACIMSGQYTPRHGIYTVGSSERGEAKLRKLVPTKNTTVLADSNVSIAEALRSAGYVCASMGKWHLGDDPKTQGFDVNIGGNTAGHPRSYFSPYKNPDMPDGPKGEYLTDRLTDEALRFVETNKDVPFFLYLPHYAVHSPIQSKREMQVKYRDRKPSIGHHDPRYAAMVESVDQSVGRIMNKLDQLGIADNTVVVFFSDNGGVKGTTSMEPLRGGKGCYYEGGIREPTIVRWPGRVKPGTVCDTPIIGIDFYPTFLEIVETKKPNGKVLDGVNLIPLLTGGTIPERPLFWHFPIYLQGKMDGARDPAFRTRPGTVVRLGDWKLHEYFEDGGLELYNLREDIGERTNLAGKMPGKVGELHEIMKEWRKATNAPVPTELNPEYDPNGVP